MGSNGKKDSRVNIGNMKSCFVKAFAWSSSHYKCFPCTKQSMFLAQHSF